MKLSDIMSAAGLHVWAEIGLIVCFITFIALLFWLFIIRRGPVFDYESRLPLDDAPLGMPGEPSEPAPDEPPAVSEETSSR